MPALGQIRHERFRQLYARLGNASEAYRQAGYQGKNADVLFSAIIGKP
jgi:phage terminase small subunit